jgi:hypothetical protein
MAGSTPSYRNQIYIAAIASATCTNVPAVTFSIVYLCDRQTVNRQLISICALWAFQMSSTIDFIELEDRFQWVRLPLAAFGLMFGPFAVLLGKERYLNSEHVYLDSALTKTCNSYGLCWLVSALPLLALYLHLALSNGCYDCTQSAWKRYLPKGMSMLLLLAAGLCIVETKWPFSGHLDLYVSAVCFGLPSRRIFVLIRHPQVLIVVRSLFLLLLSATNKKKRERRKVSPTQVGQLTSIEIKKKASEAFVHYFNAAIDTEELHAERWMRLGAQFDRALNASNEETLALLLDGVGKGSMGVYLFLERLSDKVNYEKVEEHLRRAGVSSETVSSLRVSFSIFASHHPNQFAGKTSIY